jgi:hypothetical protein
MSNPYTMEDMVDKINEHARQAGLEKSINETINIVTERESKAVQAARTYLRSVAFTDMADILGLKICEAHYDWERVVLVFADGRYLCLESESETGMRAVALDTFDAGELGLLPENLQTEIQEATADKNKKLRKLKAQQSIKCAIATLGPDKVREILGDV